MPIKGFLHKRMIVIVFIASASIAAVFGWKFDSDDTVPPPDAIEEYLFWNPKPLQDFTLVAANNEQLVFDDLLGKWSFIFFGYTHCPDVCPVTLGVMSAAIRSLEVNPDIAPELQGIFISVDPNRDSPEHLKKYTSYFHPKFIGVTGDTAQINAITRQMSALYAIHNDDSNEQYQVSHNSTVFLIDPKGRLYGRFPPPHSSEEIVTAFTGIRTFYKTQENKGWLIF